MNGIRFRNPTFDPWFSANGSETMTLSSGITLYRPDYIFNVMICADQYKICNSATSLCTPLGRRADLLDQLVILNTTDALSPSQVATAERIFFSLANSGTWNSVYGLGSSALWASARALRQISPGLPDNQWQLEATGWFQTSMAQVQAKVVEFASNPPQADLTVLPVCEALDCSTEASWRQQCANQLVRTAGEVRNFSFVGVIITVCVSSALILLGLTLEGIMDFFSKRKDNISLVARHADENLYLLAAVLASQCRPGGEGTGNWQTTWAKVPVFSGQAGWQRPTRIKDLAVYMEEGGHDAVAVEGGDTGINNPHINRYGLKTQGDP